MHRIYSSPLLRTLNTAKIAFELGPLAEGQKKSTEEMIDNHIKTYSEQNNKFEERIVDEGLLRHDSRLREISFGLLEGITVKDMRFVEQDITMNLFLNGKMERTDIETPSSVMKRIASATKEFEGGNSNNVMFTHKGILSILINHIGFDGFFLQNCASLVVEFNEEGLPLKLHRFWNSMEMSKLSYSEPV